MNQDHVIDLFNALGGKDLVAPNGFFDGCHPNDEGYEIIAKTVYN